MMPVVRLVPAAAVNLPVLTLPMLIDPPVRVSARRATETPPM